MLNMFTVFFSEIYGILNVFFNLTLAFLWLATHIVKRFHSLKRRRKLSLLLLL